MSIQAPRISVEMILEWVASGATRDEIVLRHPHLTPADVEQALNYSAAMKNEVLLTTHVSE